MPEKLGLSKLIELPENGEEKVLIEDREYPPTDENPEEKIDEIVMRESFQKVELFCLKKKQKNMHIYALADGSYIAERLNDKGEQEEVFYFDKKGDLIEFVDRKYALKELKETAEKIKENFQKIQAAMVEMLTSDPLYSKITKH